MAGLTPEDIATIQRALPRLSPDRQQKALAVLRENGVKFEPSENQPLPGGLGYSAPGDSVTKKPLPDADPSVKYPTRQAANDARQIGGGGVQDWLARRRLESRRQREALGQRRLGPLTPEQELGRAQHDPDLGTTTRAAATLLPLAAVVNNAVGRGATLGLSNVPARALPADRGESEATRVFDKNLGQESVPIDFELDARGRRVPITPGKVSQNAQGKVVYTSPDRIPATYSGRRGTGIRGGQVVERMADRSPAALPIAAASSMLPMGVPGRIASGAVDLANVGKTGLSMAQRATRAAGGAAMGGAATGAVDQASEAAGRLAEGDVAGAEKAVAAIPARATADGGLALAMLPLMGGAAMAGRGYARALRESPQVGPDLVKAEQAGMTTRMGIPGVTPPIKPTREIAAAQRVQATTGIPAQELSARSAARAALKQLGAEKDRVTSQIGTESGLYEASPEGAQRFEADPAVEAVADILQQGKSFWDTDLPAVQLEPARAQIRRLLRARQIPADQVPQGAHVITADQAADLGIDVKSEMPVPETRTGRQDELDLEAGGPEAAKGVIVLETLPMNAAELERAIKAFSFKAQEGKNVHTADAEAAHQYESIGNALRSMRQQFAPNKVTAKRGPGGEPLPKLDEQGEPIKGQYEPMEATLSTGRKVRGYAALKQSQHERLGDMQNQLKAFGLPENVDTIDPKDVGQLRQVMARISEGSPELEKLAPGDKSRQRKIRTAAAHRAYDRIVSGDISTHLSGGASGTALRASFGRSAKLRLDPIARAVGGVNLPSGKRAGIAAERAARPAAQVDGALVDRFMQALGIEPEEKQQ